MGYTHDWERRTSLPLRQFAAAVRDCRKLYQALPIPLGDAQGHGQPIFSGREICFNGHVNSGQLTGIQRVKGIVWPADGTHGIAFIGQPDACQSYWQAGPEARGRVLGPNGNGSYETFSVPRVYRPTYLGKKSRNGWWSDFCKTNFRPYDLCVQGCLIILSHHLGDAQFRVRSDGNSAQWNDARDACQHVLGYGIDWGTGKLALVEPVRATGPA